MFEKLSTRNVQKNFDPEYSIRNVRKKFDLECSKNFRPEMLEQFPPQNIRKISTQVRKMSELFPTRNIKKHFDTKCSKNVRPEVFGIILTQEIQKKLSQEF